MRYINQNVMGRLWINACILDSRAVGVVRTKMAASGFYMQYSKIADHSDRAV
jgi:hypothetical protein